MRRLGAASEDTVSLRTRLRVLLVCAALEFAAFSGMPMRADEIEDLMRQMNRPKLAHALPANRYEGDKPA